MVSNYKKKFTFSFCVFFPVNISLTDSLSLEMFCCKHFPITSSFAFSLHVFVWMLFFLVYIFPLMLVTMVMAIAAAMTVAMYDWCCHFCYSATYFPAYVVVMRCFSSVTLTFLGTLLVLLCCC